MVLMMVHQFMHHAINEMGSLRRPRHRHGLTETFCDTFSAEPLPYDPVMRYMRRHVSRWDTIALVPRKQKSPSPFIPTAAPSAETAPVERTTDHMTETLDIPIP